MNPVIFLWAHPRSMSTAIERIMRERGDFDCLHEPFLHYYYIERSDRGLPHFDHEREHPTSYAGTRDLILRQAESSPVFAKDMSYYEMPEILEDESFCRRVRHCFLIRNPLRSILSSLPTPSSMMFLSEPLPIRLVSIPRTNAAAVMTSITTSTLPKTLKTNRVGDRPRLRTAYSKRNRRMDSLFDILFHTALKQLAIS